MIKVTVLNFLEIAKSLMYEVIYPRLAICMRSEWYGGKNFMLWNKFKGQSKDPLISHSPFCGSII